MKNKTLISPIIGIIISYVMYIAIIAISEYNNDWDAYERLYNGIQTDSKDIGYNLLMNLGNYFGLSFSEFYTFIQIAIFSLLIFPFIRYKTGKYVIYAIFCLTLLAPNIAILIRYYLAFAIFFVAQFILKRKLLKILYTLFALSVHSGILCLLPLLILRGYIKKHIYTINKYISQIVLFSFFLFLAKEFVLIVLAKVGFSVFSVYNGNYATLGATIFTDIRYFIWFVFVLYIHNKLTAKDIIIINDKTYITLLSANIYPFLFIFLSNIQIVADRIFEPLLIFSLLYVLYVLKIYSNIKLGVIKILYLVLLVSILLKYFIISFFTGSISEWIIYYQEIILSEKIIYN